MFFRDVAGDPPSDSNAYCAAHHRAYSRLATDLNSGDVASYTFITHAVPCHPSRRQNGYAGAVQYTHSSILKSVEEILALPPLATVAGAHDLADLFEPNRFP